ncbi:MAG: Hsp20/alpha crystallin family protein [Bacteroidetes bacterium]|nr:Hsp20/alpha crystallin family protein [Bacteroidota bacterium]
MSLVKFDPWRSLESAEHEMKHFFESFKWPVSTTFEKPEYMPKVDTSEDEKNLYLTAELPGMTKEDVKISISEGILTIRGKKERKEEKKEKDYHRVERSFGEFVRQFELPEGFKKDKIVATVKDGILEVTIPKNGASKPKEEEQIVPIQ